MEHGVKDVVDIVYRRWALQVSEVTLVLDRVRRPGQVAASPATNPGSADGTIEVLPYYGVTEITRERGGPGPDGRCRTADDEPLSDDGTVALEEEGSEPIPDRELDPDACYRYTFTRISPWTPEEGRASTLSGVVQPADPDQTAPQLVRAVREGDRSARLVFDEPVLPLVDFHAVAWCSGTGPYMNSGFEVTEDRGDLIVTYSGDLGPCPSVALPDRVARDAAGNIAPAASAQLD
jgi:hypothetical protein